MIDISLMSAAGNASETDKEEPVELYDHEVQALFKFMVELNEHFLHRPLTVMSIEDMRKRTEEFGLKLGLVLVFNYDLVENRPQIFPKARLGALDNERQLWESRQVTREDDDKNPLRDALS